MPLTKASYAQAVVHFASQIVTNNLAIAGSDGPDTQKLRKMFRHLSPAEDLYDDAEIAWRAWLEDADNWDEFGSPRLELAEWLFASAKTNGENDGR